MKIEAKKLIRQMDQLPDAQRARLVKAVRQNTEEGARVAKTLAPDASGETRDNITTEFSPDGMTGVVMVIENDASNEDKDRAYSIEHGRKAGDRGTTEGFHHIWRTRQFLTKKFKGRISRAINRAVKEVSNG